LLPKKNNLIKLNFMKKFLLPTLLFLFALSACNTDKNTYALIETDYGNIKVHLYDDTPLHKENFIKLANEGFYDGLLFHRIINGFMMQGGDPDSRDAKPNVPFGRGGPGYQIPGEFGHLHFKGALAAARTGNPERKSSGSQFYIVQGTPVGDTQMDAISKQKGISYSAEDRKRYKEMGGTIQLDNDYTAFGEVVEGLDIIDKIAAVQTSKPGDRPNSDVTMKIYKSK